LWAATQAATGTGSSSAAPLVGAALGIATAVVLGYLFYRGAVTINLSKFFTWTGAVLIVVAAGVLGYGVHDLQEAGVLPGLNSLAFDVSRAFDANVAMRWLATLLKGIFNFTPNTTWLQAVAWVAYLGAVMPLFLRVIRRSRQAPSTPATRVPAGSPS